MRPLWQLIMFFLVTTTLWILLHAYVYRRVIRPVRALPRWARRAAIAALASTAVMGPVVMAMRRLSGTQGMLYEVRWAGYLVIGIVALLLCFTLLRDAAWMLVRGADVLWSRWQRRRAGGQELGESAHLLPADPGRRRFLFNATSAGVVAATGIGGGVGVYTARRTPPIREVDVPVEGLHRGLDGLRIAQLSDVHVGPTITSEDFSAMVDRVNAARPDLIVITGDLVDGFVDDMREDVAPLGRLEAPLGVYYCTGNHEYYWDGPAWCEEVARHGVHVLTNRHEVIEHNGGRLLVGGVNDLSAGRRLPEHATDPAAAIANAPDVDFRIALAHQPRSIHEVARAGFDLQISGHTHGGQFFPLMLFVGLAHPFTAGLHRYDVAATAEQAARSMQIFVSTGAGYWGPPQRLGVPSELPVLTLRRS